MTTEADHIVVYCTVSSGEEGAKLGKALVEEKLAACVNIVGNLRSIYLWEEKICDDPEALLIIKTRGAFFDALKDRIVELHPYDVPEVIALPIVDGHQPYLDWIGNSTKR